MVAVVVERGSRGPVPLGVSGGYALGGSVSDDLRRRVQLRVQLLQQGSQGWNQVISERCVYAQVAKPEQCKSSEAEHQTHRRERSAGDS